MDLTPLITDAAAHVQIPGDLLAALVLVESGGNPYAWNPEPRYRWFWDVRGHHPYRDVRPSEVLSKFPPEGFASLSGDPDQEWWGQQASWGLCQIMGAVAREHGFIGPYLTQLVDPAINLTLGAKHLAAALGWAKGNEAVALGSYNAGRGNALGSVGRAYAAKVLAARGLP
jgi:soluble lytic murein transglycosylase-like protein